jgi:hypothetical protein
VNTLQELLNKYQRFFLIGFILFAIGLTVSSVKHNTDQRSHAALDGSVEPESGMLSGKAAVIADAAASGGQAILLNGTAVQSTGFQPSAPYYAAFYYPWFKNAATDGSWSGSTWSDADVKGTHTPPANWFSNYLPDPNPSAFDPANELYSSNNYTTFKWQVSKMAEAKVEVAISSWWGQGHKTDVTFNSIVNDFMKRSDNPYPNLRWALYYEKEGFGDPSVSEIASDLSYIASHYASSPYMLKVNGKPVIFVYGDANDGATTATRWAQARAQVGTKFYVVLKVFSGYATTPDQPDDWHQYNPAVRSDSQGSHSFSISPGFWRSGDPVRLGRDATAFQSAVSAMVASSARWKLITTWNEWGEGTAVEPGEQVIQANGATKATLDPAGTLFGNKYIDILKNSLPNLEQGVGSQPTQSTPTPTTQASASDPVLAAAGDIACGSATSTALPCQQQATANLIASINPTAVMPLGDNQYDNGSLSDYQNYYGKSWGAFKAKTHPVIGNHEGGEGGSNQGYFDYFNGVGVQTGAAGDRSKGYYSYDLGSWHIIVLNGNCGGFSFNGSSTVCDQGGAQEIWLRQDLAAHTNTCTLAAWHEPYYSSGHDGDIINTAVYKPFWQDLYAAGADVVLSGHSHDYERFALQDPNSNIDTTKGIRQFVVGTGGRDFTGFRTSVPNSQVFDNKTFGVLKLTLHSGSYDWQFIPATGVNGYTNGTFTDSGTQQCH